MLLTITLKFFTTGRIIFASLFATVFIGYLIYSYKKDAKSHKKHYKNGALQVSIWYAIIILIFLLFRFHGAIRNFFFG